MTVMEETIDYAISAFQIMMGTLGVSASLSMIIFYIRTPDKRSPFTTICASRCIAHVVNASVHGLYLGVIIGLSRYLGRPLAAPFSCTVHIWWFAICPMEAVLSFNRLIAIRYWMYYSSIFTTFRTQLIMLVCWISAFTYGSIRVYQGCYLSFDVSQFSFIYNKASCFVADNVLGNYVVMTTHALSVIMNVFTFVQIIAKLRDDSADMASKARMKTSNRLFFQSVAQNVIWLCSTTLWTTDAYNFSDSKYYKLFCTVIIQCGAHSVESIIIYMIQVRGATRARVVPSKNTAGSTQPSAQSITTDPTIQE